jgi:hypothetical protein
MRRKIVVVHLPMEHRTQEGTPAIDAHSTQGTTPNSGTILGMTKVGRIVVMVGDGNGNSTRDTGSLDLESISIMQEQDSKL